jgi:hypothetical protein
MKRDGEQIYQSNVANMNTIDTLLYDENLLPKQNYTYTAYYTIGGVVQDSSAPLLVTPMDTTGHEFMWEIDTLGEGNGSAEPTGPLGWISVKLKIDLGDYKPEIIHSKAI